MKTFFILLLFILFCCTSVFIAAPELFSQTNRGMRIKVLTDAGEEIELYKSSYALVIGNANYTHWNPLPGALHDVKQVKAALETHGFNVTLKTDLHKLDFDRALTEFVIEAGSEKANRLLFYYAGHGYTRKSATDEDLGYLVMVDAPKPIADAVGFELASIDMKALVIEAEKIRARHVLFLFDSCFSGTILNVRDEMEPPESISDSVKYPVRQFITAGRAGEVVPDHSDFKQVFLDLIQGRDREPFPDGYITGEELGYYLKHQVPVYNKVQHPQYGKIRDPRLDKGDFVFVLSRNGGNNNGELDTIATLAINSTPSGATVYVDGISIGNTPLQGYQIDTGGRGEKQVKVGLELAGYQSRIRQVMLEGGKPFSWDVRLEGKKQPVAAATAAGIQSQKVQIIEIYQKQAPVVTLVEPTQARVRVEGRTLSLIATAVDDKGITRVELTVNGEVIEKVGRGMRAAAPKDRTIKEKIPLTYGENTIRLVVYDTDDQSSQPLIISATRTREQPRQDYALLFATDTYDAWEPLKNPIHDAQTVGNELESRYGFAVELVRNPTRAEIFSKLREYAQKRYNVDDQLLIFFAGHGHFGEAFRVGYLITKDSSRPVRDPSMTTAIHHGQLHHIIDNIPCEHIFLVIDACFSGTFDERVVQRGEEADELYKGVDPTTFIKRTLAIKTRWYLTSGGKEYVSDGKPGAHSPFARNMLEALRSNGGEDGVLTLSELEGYVEKTEPRPQAGEFGDNEPGSNFLFIRK